MLTLPAAETEAGWADWHSPDKLDSTWHFALPAAALDVPVDEFQT
jgi:hypothetical protein